MILDCKKSKELLEYLLSGVAGNRYILDPAELLIIGGIFPVFIGVCKINLSLPGNQNLKGKRKVIHSLSTRIRNKYSVAIAEVENNDIWQIATLGICTISNDARHAEQILNKIFNFITENQGDYYLLDHQIKILSELNHHR